MEEKELVYMADCTNMEKIKSKIVHYSIIHVSRLLYWEAIWY